jgi:hypothetical protein
MKPGVDNSLVEAMLLADKAKDEKCIHKHIHGLSSFNNEHVVVQNPEKHGLGIG